MLIHDKSTQIFQHNAYLFTKITIFAENFKQI